MPSVRLRGVTDHLRRSLPTAVMRASCRLGMQAAIVATVGGLCETTLSGGGPFGVGLRTSVSSGGALENSTPGGTRARTSVPRLTHGLAAFANGALPGACRACAACAPRARACEAELELATRLLAPGGHSTGSCTPWSSRSARCMLCASRSRARNMRIARWSSSRHSRVSQPLVRARPWTKSAPARSVKTASSWAVALRLVSR